MSDKRQVTVEEHYVPKVYVKGFSPDSKAIYEYRIKDGFQPPKPVPIESICIKKNIYEFQNENNEIILQNYLENILGGIETLFGKYRKQLESKAFIERNYQSLCFLTTQEKSFWKNYIAIQMMRTPKVLQLIQEQAEITFQGQLKRNEAKAIAIYGSLPVFQQIKEGDKYLIVEVLRVLNTMSIAVGVDETDSLFTSDYPVFIYSPEYKPEYRIKNMEELRFPLTSKLMIFLFGGKRIEEHRKNSLFPIQEDELDMIKQSIVYAADEWVYSKKSLTPREIELVKAAYSEKLQDMKKEKG